VTEESMAANLWRQSSAEIDEMAKTTIKLSTLSALRNRFRSVNQTNIIDKIREEEYKRKEFNRLFGMRCCKERGVRRCGSRRC
jgi:hypothetical protein